jgi:O-antigen ligase
VLAGVVVAGVLAVDPSGWSPFGPSKWLAVSGVALVGVALMAWSRRPLAVPRRAMLAWGVFLAWGAVAAAGGVDRLYAWVGTAGVAGAWAVVEQLGWQPVAVNAGNRLVGSMGSAAFLGAATTLLVPLAIGVAIDRSWSRPARWGAAVCATLATAALIGSRARAAWLAIAAVTGLVLATRRRKLSTRPKRAAALGAAGLVVVLGMGAAFGVAGRIPAAFDQSQAGGSSRVWSNQDLGTIVKNVVSIPNVTMTAGQAQVTVQLPNPSGGPSPEAMVVGTPG